MSTIQQTLNQVDAEAAALVDVALAEVRGSKTLLDALKERVRAGDPDVAPAELSQAAALVEHAELRVAAAERRADVHRAAGRAEVYVEIGAQARAFDATDDQLVADAFNTAVDALTQLHTVARTRQTQLDAIAIAAEAVVEVAKNHDERPALRAAGIHNAGGDGAGNRQLIVIDEHGAGHTLTGVKAHQVALAALHAAIGPAIHDYVPTLGADVEHQARPAFREFPDLAPAERRIAARA